MAPNSSQQYVEKYAEAAMEQQRKYGIPASVTLAQGLLESANGKSQLSRECNNHFGIKASKSWLQSGGGYALYTDDRPNEKFCKYASVADSYEHHSQFLKNNARYAKCFNLSPTDYRGWCQGLQNAGYASSKQYASSLISVIDRMDLTRFDKMAMSTSAQQTSEKVSEKELASNSPSTTQTQTQTPAQSQPTEAKSEAKEDKDDWMKKMLASEDANGFAMGGDPVVEMAVTMFSSLMALAVQIDGKDDKELSNGKSDSVDISSLTPKLKGCELQMSPSGNPILAVNAGTLKFNHQLSDTEMNRLSNVLNDSTLSAEAKQQRVSNIVGNIVIAEQMSQNFDQQLAQTQTQRINR